PKADAAIRLDLAYARADPGGSAFGAHDDALPVAYQRAVRAHFRRVGAGRPVGYTQNGAAGLECGFHFWSAPLAGQGALHGHFSVFLANLVSEHESSLGVVLNKFQSKKKKQPAD